MKCMLLLFVSSLLLLDHVACAQTLHRYKNDMKHVLGDVKQAQIQNILTSTSQINNLLDGFEDMGFNGVRIAIFADGVNPNVRMYDALYDEAKKRGFNIFANPAQHSGGQRIANGGLDIGPSPRNRNAATEALIDRIQEFADEYKCTWISPFNEDGRPGAAWSVDQMNTIHRSLRNSLNGADLIGPCVWGIPASVSVMKDTDVGDYVKIATTHNLGFNHDHWDDFIAEANKHRLDVWDSEVNDNKKFSNKSTRLDAALDAKVDGLVMYDSWRFINLSNGSIRASGQQIKAKITQYYTLENVGTREVLVPSGDSSGSRVTASSSGGRDTEEWEAVPPRIKDSASKKIRFRNRKTGHFFQPQTDKNSSQVRTLGSCSGSCLHTQWELSNAGGGAVYLDNVGSDTRLNIGSSGNVQMAPSWTGSRSKWKAIAA